MGREIRIRTANKKKEHHFHLAIGIQSQRQKCNTSSNCGKIAKRVKIKKETANYVLVEIVAEQADHPAGDQGCNGSSMNIGSDFLISRMSDYRIFRWKKIGQFFRIGFCPGKIFGIFGYPLQPCWGKK
jgi:hypothetical protein